MLDRAGQAREIDNERQDPMTTPQDVRALADEPLLDALKSVVARANEITTELLVHLGEVDARKLYLGQATSSPREACTCRD